MKILLFWSQIKGSEVAKRWKGLDPILKHESDILVKIRLHAEKCLPRFLGSGLKVCEVWCGDDVYV